MNDATPRFHMATQTPLNDSETPITNSIPNCSADFDKNVDAIKKKSVIPECSDSDSIKKIKEHVEKTKVDNLPNKIKSTEAKAIPTPKKKDSC